MLGFKQTLFHNFKKEVTKFMHELTKVKIPKMQANIAKANLHLKQVLNEPNIPEEVWQTEATEDWPLAVQSSLLGF